MSDLSRRHFIAGLGMTASLPFLSAASAAQVPPAAPEHAQIDHLDVIVPNVEASARFYMGVFNTTLHVEKGWDRRACPARALLARPLHT